MNFELKKTRDYFRKPDYLLENIGDSLFASGFLDKGIRIKTHSSKIFITGHPMELFSLNSPELFLLLLLFLLCMRFLFGISKLVQQDSRIFPYFPIFPIKFCFAFCALKSANFTAPNFFSYSVLEPIFLFYVPFKNINVYTLIFRRFSLKFLTFLK